MEKGKATNGSKPVSRKTTDAGKKKSKRETKRVAAGVRGIVSMSAAASAAPVLAITEAAQALAAPFGLTTPRFSTEFTTAKTAVATPWERIDGRWAPNEGTVYPLSPYPPSSQMFGALFRDPVRSAVLYDANASTEPFEYRAQFNTSISALEPGSNAFTYVSKTAADYPHMSALQTVQWRAVTDFQPHGPTQYPGIAQGSDGKFVWLDTLSTAGLTNSITAAFNASLTSGQQAKMCLDRWDDGRIEEELVSGSAVSGQSSIVLLVPYSGYYAVRFASNFNCTITNLRYYNNGSPVYCHLPLPGLTANAASAPAIRVTAASLMYTNEAAPLNKQGKITGLQAPEGLGWTKYVAGGNPFANVSGDNNAVTMPANNGLYGFLKPTKMTDFDFRAHLEMTGDGVLIDSHYPLREQSAYLVISVSITVAAGRDSYWTRTYGIEYETTDVWRSLDAPNLRASEFQAALLLLKSVSQWHENPLHWSDVKKAVAGALRTAVRLAPQIQKLASTALPMLL